MKHYRAASALLPLLLFLLVLLFLDACIIFGRAENNDHDVIRVSSGETCQSSDNVVKCQEASRSVCTNGSDDPSSQAGSQAGGTCTSSSSNLQQQEELLLWFQQVGPELHGVAPHDLFGWSVSTSHDGSIVAVGAIHNQDQGYSGTVRVFEEVDDASTATKVVVWSQRGSDIQAGDDADYFGYSISLSGNGNIVAVGAPYYSSTAEKTSCGRVHVFQFISTSTGRENNDNNNKDWVNVGQDEALDGNNSKDGFGHSLALSSDGHTIVIGAPYHVYNGQEKSGLVRVHRLVNNNDDQLLWKQVGATIHGGGGDLFGYSVAISADGSTFAVGAKNHKHGIHGRLAGLVRVYRILLETEEWMQVGNDIYGQAEGDYSGFSVSLSGNGNILAIGAPYHDGKNGKDSGHVRVYQQYDNTEHNNVSWIQLGGDDDDMDGEENGDYFGYSVSLSNNGRTMAVGARMNSHGSGGPLSGHVRVFYYVLNDGWIQLGHDIDGEAESDQSGFTVALSGNAQRLVIGAPYNDDATASGQNEKVVISNAGHARIYAFQQQQQQQQCCS